MHQADKAVHPLPGFSGPFPGFSGPLPGMAGIPPTSYCVLHYADMGT